MNNKKHLLESSKTTLLNISDTNSLLKTISASPRKLKSNEAAGMLDLINCRLNSIKNSTQKEERVVENSQYGSNSPFTYNEACSDINELKNNLPSPEQNNSLFGLEKDNSLMASLLGVHQTFCGIDLYPSAQEKAANLLYFLIKNHSFLDGNKRIASHLFLKFLRKNSFPTSKIAPFSAKISPLAAIILMVAESSPENRKCLIDIILSWVKSVTTAENLNQEKEGVRQ